MINNIRLVKTLMTVAVLMRVLFVQPAQSEGAAMIVPKGHKITSMTLVYGDKGKNPVDNIEIPIDGLKNINKNLAKEKIIYSTVSHDQPNYLEYSLVDSSGKPVHHGINDVPNNEPGVTNWEFTTTHSRFAGHYFKYQLDNKKKVYNSPFASKGQKLSIVLGK